MRTYIWESLTYLYSFVMKKSLILAAVFALAFSAEVSAQSLKDILGTVGNVVSAVTGNTATENSIQGTWNYVSPAVKFESDNMLASAGGAVASATVKNKLDKYYQKAGIKPGACTFVFNADKTFSVTIAGRTSNGTYELDSQAGTVAMTFKVAGMRIATFNANIYKTSGNMALAFTADKLLGIVKTVVAKVPSAASTAAVGSLLGNYDGLLVGFEFSK